MHGHLSRDGLEENVSCRCGRSIDTKEIFRGGEVYGYQPFIYTICKGNPHRHATFGGINFNIHESLRASMISKLHRE